VFGLGFSQELVEAFRADSSLIDSFDNATAERIAINSRTLDDDLKQVQWNCPRGAESSTARADAARDHLIDLNIRLGQADETSSGPSQSFLSQFGPPAATDGGSDE
jgi:hypothetical protein